MDLSIVIVNYNTKDLLHQTINSIYESNPDSMFEVIVSDNGSKDGSYEHVEKEFPEVIWIANKENLGFAKANNIAIRKAQGKYILLLNSDTVITKNCLDICLDYLRNHKDIGALGCKVVLLNGKLDLACRRSFPTPQVSLYRMIGLAKIFPQSKLFGKYNLTYLDEDEIYEVDSIVGAFMLIPSEVLKQVGLFDEDFFMYGEDIDLCFRIKSAGWKIMYYPEGKIIHYKGASGGKKNNKIIFEFYRAMYLFYQKHYAKKYFWVINLVIYTGIGLKLALSLIINLVKKRNL